MVKVSGQEYNVAAVSNSFQLMWADEILYVFGLGMVKISLLLTYLRFFSSDRFRQVTYIVIGLNAAFIIVFFIVVMCQCKPMSYIWYALSRAIVASSMADEHSRNQWDGEHEGTCLPINPVVWSA